MNSAIIFTLIMVVGIGIASFATGFAHKRDKEKEVEVVDSTPVYRDPKKPEETKAVFKQASEIEGYHGQYQRIDAVLGIINLRGVEHNTFNKGEITIYNEDGKPVLAFHIAGRGNAPRYITLITVGDDLNQGGVMYYVKTNPQDFELFNKWLNEQLYGGPHMRVAQSFQEEMSDIANFNDLLAQGRIKCEAGGARYVAL